MIDVRDCRTKLIVMVDRNLQRSPCMASGGRGKRQADPTDIVPFNKTLLTAALASSQSDIQSVRLVNLIEHDTLVTIFDM